MPPRTAKKTSPGPGGKAVEEIKVGEVKIEEVKIEAQPVVSQVVEVGPEREPEAEPETKLVANGLVSMKRLDVSRPATRPMQIVEAWSVGDADAETKVRIEVHLDGEEHIGLALDQMIPGRGTIPLSPYYFWPRKDALEELKVMLETKS
ncbi:ribosomal protein PSRP-3/Ycf65 [Actinidia rufa]|uniref:Ribosomal protein PSRP-3/Ycf65 n=1 Tax=Actinidia rufa TaxID=165716 RepID=A0A7J0GDZ9_9ERIC|nr:ribosomal protein PSRP-3/Ycf65 [Actinidia rufa]